MYNEITCKIKETEESEVKTVVNEHSSGSDQMKETIKLPTVMKQQNMTFNKLKNRHPPWISL